MDIKHVVDRIEITDFFSRYARAVDTRDWDLYRTLFTKDAHIDYSSSGGSVGNLEETVSFLSKALDMFEMSQHLVTNIEVLTKKENEADVLALFNNPMRLNGGEIWFVGGKYRHELIRSDSGWKSRKLIEETLWFDRSPFGDPTEDNLEKKE
jgi:3-phenylpropionate/cinnamic acid dioxygenase small subunit